MEDPGRDGGQGAYEDASRSSALRALLLRLRQRHPLEELTVHCAWCNRIKRGEAWVLEEARSARFRRRSESGATHGICPDCLAQLNALPPE